MKYLVTLFQEDEEREFQHEFEAENLDDARNAATQFCSMWKCKVMKLEKKAEPHGR
jgi:hypothetical protein